MALRGDYFTIRLQQHSSGSVNEVIAETTSVNVDFSAEFLETTSQTSGLNTSGIAGKVTGTASGNFLVASDAEQFDLLFVHMNAGNTLEVEMYINGVKNIDCDGVLTSLTMSGGNSDILTTGSWSMTLSGNPAV